MRATMEIRKFEPKFMKIGVLTAALQELTPREVRDADPDRVHVSATRPTTVLVAGDVTSRTPVVMGSVQRVPEKSLS